MDDHVERLHIALAAALRQNRPEPFTAPVTVAEIYQDLVPYRAVRSTVGFEMNADYEHALLQLLAGVGGCVRIEPERAGEELREELTSPNPNVGLFRKFAACEVWVNEPARMTLDGDQTEAFAPEPVAPTNGAAVKAAPERSASQPSAPGPAAAQPGAHAPARYSAPSLWRPSEEGDEAAATAGASDVEGEPAPARAQRPRGIAPPVGQPEVRPDFDPRCGFCDSALPGGRIVRFCPHCGADQALRPCASCGEPLDSSWGFCIACGAVQE